MNEKILRTKKNGMLVLVVTLLMLVAALADRLVLLGLLA